MRGWCMAGVLALCSSGVLAADFGIGVSARSDDGWLYVPIDVAKSFRIEPSIRYGTSEIEFSEGDATEGQETETWEAGIGLFGLRHLTEAAHVYYGVRLAYVDIESTVIQSGILSQPIRSESTQDGYRISPTLGFEYVFGGHFSVGGEAAYSFLDVEGESTSRVGNLDLSTLRTEQKSQGTQTRLIFRYMF